MTAPRLRVLPGTVPARGVPAMLADLRSLDAQLRFEAARVTKTLADYEADPMHEDAARFINDLAEEHTKTLRRLAKLADKVTVMAADIVERSEPPEPEEE